MLQIATAHWQHWGLSAQLFTARCCQQYLPGNMRQLQSRVSSALSSNAPISPHAKRVSRSLRGMINGAGRHIMKETEPRT